MSELLLRTEPIYTQLQTVVKLTHYFESFDDFKTKRVLHSLTAI